MPESEAPDIQETPSTIKASVKRWIIVSTVIITLLFFYLVMVMSEKDREKAASQQEELSVPQQTQEATSKSPAIETFQYSMNVPRERRGAPDTMQDTPIHKDFAPRKSSIREQYQSSKRANQNPQDGAQEKSMYETFQEEEELRALKSIRAKGDIGDDTAFYKEKANVPGEAAQKYRPAPKPSFAEKKQLLALKRESMSKYIQDISSGRVDPSAPPPPELRQTLEGYK